MEPLVSLCIPCHNAAPWLAATLDAAFAQTWPRCEVILVDDGSTDDSWSVACGYEHRGLRLARQSNRGQSSACNHALQLAGGDFVKFLDADDLISPEMIALQVAGLSQRPGSLAYGEWARFTVDPGEAEFRRRPGWHDAAPVDWLVEIWADAQPMMQCAQFLVPRCLLQQRGGWDERLSLINDLELFTRLTLASDGLVFTPGARLYYRSNLPGSLSGSRSAPAWESAFLSVDLATRHLFGVENSPRTRRVCASMLAGLLFAMYPNMPTLTARLESRIAELGGSGLRPLGGRGFQIAGRLLGWKTARWLQMWTGKYPRPRVR